MIFSILKKYLLAIRNMLWIKTKEHPNKKYDPESIGFCKGVCISIAFPRRALVFIPFLEGVSA